MLLEDGIADTKTQTETSQNTSAQQIHATSSKANPTDLLLSIEDDSGHKAFQAPTGAVTSGVDEDAAFAVKAEQRRRMDEIVENHILDLHVYDKPYTKPTNARHECLDEQFFMSGAIVTGPVDELFRNAAPSATTRNNRSFGLLAVPEEPGASDEASAMPSRRSRRLLFSAQTSKVGDTTLDEPSTLNSPTVQTKAKQLSSGEPTTPAHPPRVRIVKPKPVLTAKRIPKDKPVFAPADFDPARDAKSASSKEEHGSSTPTSAGQETPRKKETPVPAPRLPSAYMIRSPSAAREETASAHEETPTPAPLTTSSRKTRASAKPQQKTATDARKGTTGAHEGATEVRKETPIPAPRPWEGLLPSPGTLGSAVSSPGQSRSSGVPAPFSPSPAPKAKKPRRSRIASSPLVKSQSAKSEDPEPEPGSTPTLTSGDSTPIRGSGRKKHVRFAN